jgi:hypothetical protein
MKKSILIFTTLVLLLFLIIPFFTSPFHLGNLNNSGGWTVGLAKLDAENLRFTVIKDLISEKRFVVIPNDNRDFKGKVEFNADPFLFVHNDSLYLFVETKPNNKKAHISAYFVNKNNLKAEYLGVAVNEDFHLSYPALYEYNGEIFMMPESQKSGKSIVYKAVDFPLKWVKCDTVFEFPVKDPTLLKITDSTGIVYYGEKMMLYRSKFIFQNNKFKTWDKEYLRAGVNSRPGGSILVMEQDTFLFLQNNFFGYGSGLDALNIKSNQAQSVLGAHENFAPFGAGMHHLNTIVFDNKVYLTFDGNRLIDENKNRNFKHAFKINYLTIWTYWFPNLEPFYPFSF